MDEFSYLFSAFNDIKGAHNGVGDAARKDTSNHTFAVVVHVVNVAASHLGILWIKFILINNYLALNIAWPCLLILFLVV